MGNSCGCGDIGETTNPQSATPQVMVATSRRESKQKFQDIIPQGQQNQCITEQDLNLFKNQLSDRLKQYEQKNGFISKRYLFENDNFSSRNQFKSQFSSNLVSERLDKNGKEERKYDYQAPIKNQNIKLQLKQDESQGFSQNQKDRSSNNSCLLSQCTHILNTSIFTQRANIVQQFYNKFKYFQQIQLLQWIQNYRKSYFISDKHISNLISFQASSGYIAILLSIQNYYDCHGIHLISFSNQPKGIKLHLNGKKRLFPLYFEQIQQPDLLQLYQRVSSYAQNAEVTHLAYCLTGWIPQILNMCQISNFQGIFERLSSNMQEGSTLICFSKRNYKNQIQYVSLNQIDLSSGLIKVSTGVKNILIPDLLVQQRPKDNELVLTFQNFVQIFDTIHLNWNPVIYQTIIKRQGIIGKNENMINKYLMVIPQSSQDIEVRLFIERHHKYNNQSRSSKKIIVQLFQYQQVQQKDNEAIRVIETQSNIFSDVFIFQTCKEKTNYLLNIRLQGQTLQQEGMYYSVTMLSFVEMQFDSVKQAPVIKQVSCNSIIEPKNRGFGINSPYFSKNIQFSIEAQVDNQLKIAVMASNSLEYEICLIPDRRGDQNLSKINLQSIINNALVSSLKKGLGSFSIKTHQRRYLLVINCFNAVEQSIKIRIELHGHQIINNNAILSIQQVQFSTNIIFVKEIKWLPNHSGPRKRLKSNSNAQFQPAQTFTQFFKNPIIDRQLAKGRYQLFVKNQTFRDYFDAVQTYQDKNMCEPPPLSIAVLQIQRQKKQYRIISDDAFYIPFGMGFWSQQMEIQQGYYRFVCPKIQNSYALGIFGIVKC